MIQLDICSPNMADWLQGPYTDINDGLVDSLLVQQKDLLINALNITSRDSIRVGEIIQAMNKPELFPSEQERFLVMLTVTRILFDVDNLSEFVGSIIKEALDKSVESFNALLELCKVVGGNVFFNMHTIIVSSREAAQILGPDLSREPRSILLEYNPQEAFLTQYGPKFGARVLYAMVNGLVTPDGHVRHEETMSMTTIWRDLLLAKATQQDAMEWFVCGVIAEKAIKQVNQGLAKRKRPGFPVPEELSTRISLN